MRTIPEECDDLLRQVTILQKGFARKLIIAWCIWAVIALSLFASLIYVAAHFIRKL